MKSARFTLSTTDWKKIGKGALIAVGGAAATYALSVLPEVDFGQYTPLVVSVLSVLLNAVLKFFSGK